MQVTLRQLQHALALARHGNFRRAAQEEHISQSAFSRSIRSLEDAVGVQLFDRRGARATPTVFGEALVRHALEINDHTVSLGKELDRLKHLETGSLRVAMGTFPAELFAADALGELARRTPEVRCGALIANFRRVEEAVMDETADLGVADIGNLRQRDRLQVEVLGAHEFVFFCRAGHPLAGRESLRLSDLESYPLAFTRIASRLKSFRSYNAAVDADTGDVLPHIEVEQFSLALAVVAASDTLGAAAPVQIERRMRGGELCVLPFRAAWMSLEYGVISLRGHAPSAAALLFAQLLREFEAKSSARNQALVEEFLPGIPRGRKPY